MSKKQPLVSAVVTTCNRADLLSRALDSVVVQTYDNLELIIVDDGSTDQTPRVIEGYKDIRSIKYIRNETSLGACRARNRGIQEANGTFVAGLDDDDKWHEERIEKMVAAYSDEYACVTSDITMVYPHAEKVWKKKRIIDLYTLLFTNQVGNQVLARRDRVLEVGGFDPDLEAAQDYDLWIRLCKEYGPILNVQEPLQTVYLGHSEDQITHQSAFKGYLQFYKKHKSLMNKAQKKYQLYNIRRAEDKPLNFTEFVGYVPPFRYMDEIKRIIAGKIWK
ncbi:MAG TPA: glycosyltransferase [Balneolaceae bacterium]|nr:glycosyltransferase [Balneolaceae bacterium]